MTALFTVSIVLIGGGAAIGYDLGNWLAGALSGVSAVVAIVVFLGD